LGRQEINVTKKVNEDKLMTLIKDRRGILTKGPRHVTRPISEEKKKGKRKSSEKGNDKGRGESQRLGTTTSFWNATYREVTTNIKSRTLRRIDVAREEG